MAMVYAALPFDQNGLDFNRLWRGAYETDFQDDYHLTAGTMRFEDIYSVAWTLDGYEMGSTFLGRGFSVGGDDVLRSGIVQGYGELVWTGWEYQPSWLIHGTSIAAADVVRAVRSPSRADDGAIFARMLAGNDRFDLSDWADRATGMDGHDQLVGLGGDDTLRGGAGNDRLVGGAQNDSLFLDAGNDTINGGSGLDWVRVEGSASASIRLDVTTPQNTGRGLDLIRLVENAAGGAGHDVLGGSAGANRLLGGLGNDRLSGLQGDDALAGGAGNDRLSGGQGRDRLAGGEGNDVVNGGAGLDLLTGNAGADQFVFSSLSDTAGSITQSDLITDFQRGRDVINLRTLDGASGLAGNNGFLFLDDAGIGTARTGAVAIRQHDRPGSANDVTVVLLDNDGDPAAEAAIRLKGLIDLTAADFLL